VRKSHLIRRTTQRLRHQAAAAPRYAYSGPVRKTLYCVRDAPAGTVSTAATSPSSRSALSGTRRESSTLSKPRAVLEYLSTSGQVKGHARQLSAILRPKPAKVDSTLSPGPTRLFVTRQRLPYSRKPVPPPLRCQTRQDDAFVKIPIDSRSLRHFLDA
jgi:hypothetical protein